MISFTTPDGQTRVTIDGDTTTEEPIAQWRQRIRESLAASRAPREPRSHEEHQNWFASQGWGCGSCDSTGWYRNKAGGEMFCASCKTSIFTEVDGVRFEKIKTHAQLGLIEIRTWAFNPGSFGWQISRQQAGEHRDIYG